MPGRNAGQQRPSAQAYPRSSPLYPCQVLSWHVSLWCSIHVSFLSFSVFSKAYYQPR